MNRKFVLSILVLVCSLLTHAQETPPLFASAEEANRSQGTAEEGDSSAVAKKLDIKVRTEFIIEKIRFNDRQVDPFGLAMDPANAVESMALSDQYQDLDETPVINNSTLTTALQTVPITGIYPNKQTVVIGARVFKRGDIFGMQLEELVIRLRLEGIKGTQIYFKDLDTQEVASIEYNTLPSTFEPITSASKPTMGAGIVPMSELYIVN